MSKKGAPGTKGLDSGKIMELVLAVVTLINLVLAMVIKVNERKTVIKAVSDDENVKALIVDKKISQEISKLG
ncbi:MAG: hypothetical protein J6M16_02935 [Clostridia bacterium]|nr:hypothetical protein [Clostridia bacterium]